MKYYKISEEELDNLVNKVLNTEADEYHSAEFVTKTGTDKAILLITGHYNTASRTYEFEEIKNGLDISKLEGAVWHGCPKTHAHTEFSELKFKGDGMFISGFCLHCEEEMVRLSEKKE